MHVVIFSGCEHAHCSLKLYLFNRCQSRNSGVEVHKERRESVVILSSNDVRETYGHVALKDCRLVNAEAPCYASTYRMYIALVSGGRDFCEITDML